MPLDGFGENTWSTIFNTLENFLSVSRFNIRKLSIIWWFSIGIQKFKPVIVKLIANCVYVQVWGENIGICFHKSHDFFPLECFNLSSHIHAMVNLIFNVLSVQILKISGNLSVVHSWESEIRHDMLLKFKCSGDIKTSTCDCIHKCLSITPFIRTLCLKEWLVHALLLFRLIRAISSRCLPKLLVNRIRFHLTWVYFFERSISGSTVTLSILLVIFVELMELVNILNIVFFHN